MLGTDLPRASSELDRYVELSAESDHVDAKGPLRWDGGAVSAKLARHIAAFANSRDGGVIVIGTAEGNSGEFMPTGLTDEQASSFETTKVARWVNNHFAPPVNLLCHQHVYNGNRYVIITISEFSDVPVICTRTFQDPANANKHILRERTIYVRNAQAESAPLATVDEFRSLIGIATTKRGDEMLRMFNSFLKGRPLLEGPPDQDPFEDELGMIEEGLGDSYQDALQKGAWWLRIRPGRFDGDRWEGDELEAIIDRRAVRLIDTFPPSRNGTHRREWGICNDLYGEIWTLSKSGQFLAIRPYFENERDYKCTWCPPDPDLPAGGWLEFSSSMMVIFEMMHFAARFVEDYETGEEIRVDLRSTGLAGRKLVTSTLEINVRGGEECRASQFNFKRALRREELIAEWEAICAEAMKEFVNYFPSRYGSADVQTMAGWVEKFKNRRF